MRYKYANDNLKSLMKTWNLFNTDDLPVITINKYSFVPMPQLILGITERCNLRCKYCIFSGNYDDMRTHNNNKMSDEIAIKALDYYFDHLNANKEYFPIQLPAITFYGGEPLLEFDLIKKVVKHAKGLDCVFNLTTNGTLLNQETIEYLVDNNFIIGISLDGPKKIHDKNRVFPDNSGSFDNVINNFKNLKSYIKKVGKTDRQMLVILSCYEDDTDLSSVNDFFSNSDLGFNNNDLVFNTILHRCTLIKEKKNHIKKPNKSFTELSKIYLQGISTGEYDKSQFLFLNQIFGSSLRSILVRFVNPYGNSAHRALGGSCIPGKKLFVSSDGRFHICERINANFSIGDYIKGFDFELINQIVERWSQSIAYYCHSCPYISLCGICYANCAEGNDFNIKKNCNKVGIENRLKTVFSILEKAPHAFDDTSEDKNLTNDNYEQYISMMKGC